VLVNELFEVELFLGPGSVLQNFFTLSLMVQQNKLERLPMECFSD
jgi:hypothetical protein